MSVYYCIVDWDENYEVDKDGRVWTPGKAFRQGPLEYLRVPARRDWNVRMMELAEKVQGMVWFYVGAFEKLCGIVACEERPRRERGVIRNSRGKSASLEDIARMLRVKPHEAQQLVTVLSEPEIHWLEAVDDGQGEQEYVGNGVYCLPQEEWDRISKHAADGQEQLVSPATPEILQEPRDVAEPADSASSPKAANIAEFGENHPHNMTRQVMSEQKENKTSYRAPGAQSLGQLTAHLLPKADTSRFPLEGFDTSRLAFLCEIRTILGVQDHDGVRSLSNFEQWVYENVASGRDGPDLRARVRAMAKQCTYGKKPVAVFMARVGRELGYVPPSRRPDRLTDKSPRQAAERKTG
jgi:hypothetical protein